MRSTKKTVHFNLTLFFLLIIGIIVMVTGSVYAEEDITAEENIKVIEV